MNLIFLEMIFIEKRRFRMTILKDNIESKISTLGMIVGLIGIFLMFSGSMAWNVPKSVAIQNVRIFDGEKIILNGTVVFQDGKIVGVGKNVSFPADAEKIDGQGKTLLPGLINAHLHVTSEDSLKQCLIFGVTTVVDMFMSTELMTAIKEKQSQGEASYMATLFSSGTLITVPGGHGTEYGIDIPTITKPEEAQEFVDARIDEGSDFIKIIYDDGSTYSTKTPTIDKKTMKAVVDAAHKRGKLAVVHIMSLQEAKEALRAGADGLAHLYCEDAYDPGFGSLVARHEAFVIPTLSVLRSMSGLVDVSVFTQDPALSRYLSPTEITNAENTFPFTTGGAAYESSKRALGQLKEANVPILAGTDAPNPGTVYGASLHRELELLVNAGLTSLEALRSATSVVAETFGLRGRGRIQKGNPADLLLVTGDPTHDIRATRDIIAVWKNGVRVDREEYRRRIAREREKLEHIKKAPPPSGSESGKISDFEEEEITAQFGAGWSISTDQIRGGKSTAAIKRVEGGAHHSDGSMLISGTVRGDGYSWAGAFFSPGTKMMSPANLSHKNSVSFWARGDGKSYSVMIFTQSGGFMPSIQHFQSKIHWEEYTFPFQKFGTDGSDIIGIFIGGSQEKGKFSLHIDDVRLK